MWYWLLKYVLVGPLLWVAGRPVIEGGEYLPSQGAAIIASNHLARVDSLFLPLMSNRRLTLVAVSDGPDGPHSFLGRIDGWVSKVFGKLPVDRFHADEARVASVRRILSKGELVCMYPEGARSPDGRLYRGRTELARLALEERVPVIPVAMIGTNIVNPPGKWFLRPAKVTVRVGKPMNFARFEGMEGNRFTERAITDEVMYALLRLSGQQYVDSYAGQSQSSPVISTSQDETTE